MRESEPIMKVYLAAASTEVEAAAAYMDALEAAGIQIAHRWDASVRKHAVTSDTELSRELRRRYASEDLCGVDRCNTLWLMAPAATSCGAWVELGWALRAGAITVVSGPWQRCIFGELADHKFATHDEAFGFLVGGGR